MLSSLQGSYLMSSRAKRSNPGRPGRLLRRPALQGAPPAEDWAPRNDGHLTPRHVPPRRRVCYRRSHRMTALPAPGSAVAEQLARIAAGLSAERLPGALRQPSLDLALAIGRPCVPPPPAPSPPALRAPAHPR